jgi:hypothetical protein
MEHGAVGKDTTFPGNALTYRVHIPVVAAQAD